MAQFKFLDLLDTNATAVACKPSEVPTNEAGISETAMADHDPVTPSEIELARHRSRLTLFKSRGVGDLAAQAVAWRLMERDRDRDDRRSCAECRHQSYEQCRKGLFPVGGFGIEMLHRCRGFTE